MTLTTSMPREPEIAGVGADRKECERVGDASGLGAGEEQEPGAAGARSEGMLSRYRWHESVPWAIKGPSLPRETH
jgi:hypothetical protein